MKRVRLLPILLSILLLSACSSLLLQVGKMASKAMQGKTGNITDLTAQVKIANYNRDYPFTDLMIGFLAAQGVNKTSIGSYTSLFLTKGMKFMEVDGTVQCNGEDMLFAGSGTYMLERKISAGDEFTFYLRGTEKGEATFTEAYQGSKVEILKPSAGDKIDISKDVQVAWTKGNDPEKVVKISMIISQMGLQNILPIAVFPDVGKATITRQMIAEVCAQPAQTIQEGDNYLILERQKDEVRYVLNGDAIVMNIDGDAVPVVVSGKAPKPVKPVVEAISVTKGDVTVNVSQADFLYLLYGGMAHLSDINTIGLSSFVMQGKTGGTKVENYKVSTYGATYQTYDVTKSYEWGADFGQDFLEQVVNTMADVFMDRVSGALAAEEVPTENIVGTKAYQRLNEVEVKSDKMSFYVTARNTTSFDGLKQFKVKIGGINSWYYDMLRSSGADAFVEVYLKLERQIPEEVKKELGKKLASPTPGFTMKSLGVTDFTFDVSVDVRYKTFPVNLVEVGKVIPSVSGHWTSETFEWDPGKTVDDFLKPIKFNDFVDAYIAALEQLKDKQEALEL